jgi:hypothetical protein
MTEGERGTRELFGIFRALRLEMSFTYFFNEKTSKLKI